MSTPPLPSKLKHLADPGRCPVHLNSGDVAVLLEFWGLTRNGGEMVKRGVKHGWLKCVRLKHQRGLRFRTEKVFAFYEEEIGI